MRQVFTSPRVENAEAVAQLLREGGIEVRLSNGRGWRGAIRGNFSYREQPSRGTQPEVWVLRSEDYPRARQLLREAGLPQGGQSGGGAYVGPSMHTATTGERAATVRRPGSRARTGALLAVALAVGAGYFLLRWSASNAPPRTAPASAPGVAAQGASPLIADAATVHVIPTPPALAAALLAASSTLPVPRDGACVSVDGKDLSENAPDSVREPRWTQASQCRQGQARIAIGPYRTDGSGTGTVEVAIVSSDGASDSWTLDVERVRDEWRVLRTVATTR